MLLFDATYRDDYPWGEISIPYKLGFSEISPPQSPLPSYLLILNLINPFIIVLIMLVYYVIYCVWQINKIK